MNIPRPELMAVDKEAFLTVIDENKRLIFKICNTYCSDREDQKDLAQEIIIQLWHSFERFDGRSKLTTWMYRVALNTAISYYRKTTTKNKHFSSVESDFIDIAEEESDQTEEGIQLLRKFISQLDEMNKAMMILYLDGNSYEEIGEVLNITPGNVGTKINRIKKKLKEQFELEER